MASHPSKSPATPQTPPWGPPVPPPPAPAALVGDGPPESTRRHGQSPLSPGWRWCLGLTWLAVVAGLGTLLDLGDYLGKLPWWSGRLLVVALGPILVLIGAIRNWPATIPLSYASSAIIGILAVVDAGERPGLAAVEALLAVAALLATAAAHGAATSHPAAST